MTVMRSFAALLLAALMPLAAMAQYLETTTHFAPRGMPGTDSLVVLVPEGLSDVSLPGWGAETTAQVNRALQAAEFDGSARQRVEILAPAGLPYERLITLGVGNPGELERPVAEEIGAALSVHINGTRAKVIELNASLISDAGDNSRLSAAIAHGVDLRNYRFDQLKSQPDARPAQTYHWVVSSVGDAQRQYNMLRAVAEGVFTARELTNLPGSNGYPAAFAEYALQTLAPLGVEVTILGPEEVLEAGMGSLYGVSQGSQHKAHLLIAHWRGSDDQPIALVGKGNTFDTGGYDLKTTSSILLMQGDKSGGAAVVGAVKALAGQQAAVNVVGVVPLSQNSISGEAILPGDVLRAGDGTTIEIGSTDAEGRLILADGIWYARDRYNPSVIVDIATLTGAKTTALGTDYSAIFSDYPELVDSMKLAGQMTDELVWQLPLGPYRGIIDSRIADIQNTGSPGAQAGAVFLQHFAADTPWLHIDMASQALLSSARGIHPAGGTGHGVRLLTEWVKIYAGVQ
ncbi:leucyl aminopeptidase family protein [Pseudohongiella spirulinae]|uniref:Putative cytosol aminopeptidase n=1 Tax=Pseudohongiella spirulinae TaxID=1249552 RepID=A0A0S2KAF5_9GAMM|nr:leucyl aminopeptidase [Pseudohongiella spirulinae]ALO44975.1 putative cytosol aminopeptidase [Pseudohongiella spirulinae]